MKEKEFLNKINKNYDNLYIKIGIFYSLDDDDNVIMDYDSMRDVFDNKMKEFEEVLNGLSKPSTNL